MVNAFAVTSLDIVATFWSVAPELVKTIFPVYVPTIVVAANLT